MRALGMLMFVGCWTGDTPAPRAPASAPAPIVVALPVPVAPPQPVASAPSRVADPANGKRLYESKGCNVCHALDGSVRVGPSWKGIWGTEVLLESGRTVKVDEVYVRRSILDSQADIVIGFPRVMPRFAGQISDDQVADLVAFIASLKS